MHEAPTLGHDSKFWENREPSDSRARSKRWVQLTHVRVRRRVHLTPPVHTFHTFGVLPRGFHCSRNAVSNSCGCVCCSAQLEPAQEFRFLVESDNLENPTYLARIRRLPAINGRPVPVCKACQVLVESVLPRPAARAYPLHSGVLAAIGLFAIGWFVQSLLFGPHD
jgi:hypothetical protein